MRIHHATILFGLLLFAAGLVNHLPGLDIIAGLFIAAGAFDWNRADRAARRREQ